MRALMLLVFACCWRLTPTSSTLPVPTPLLPSAHIGAVADGTGARWAGTGAAGIEGHVYPATPGDRAKPALPENGPQSVRSGQRARPLEGLDISAALYHFIRRDAVLKRMLPRARGGF
jgi:hypothetical protein